MKKKIDLTGKIFGRCKVIKEYFRKNDIRKYPIREWLLKCKCKTLFIRLQQDIRNGLVFECPNCHFRRSQYYLGGKKFGRLHVQHKYESRKNEKGHVYRAWWCKCECGNSKWIRATSIIKSHTTSCGCYASKVVSRFANETLYPIRHGKSGDPLYKLWITIIHKCYNPKYSSYHLFGEEGYTICDDWKNSFESFYQWMKEKKWKKGFTISLKNEKKEFNPKNSIIIPVKELYRSSREKSILRKFGITYKGKTLHLRDWAKKINIPYKTLYTRIKRGLTFEEAFNRKFYEGSGSVLKRNDISDKEIKKMYESGMTMIEINKKTNSTVSKYRLKKMGIKGRADKKRSSVKIQNIIKEMTEKKAFFEEILKKTGYKHPYSLVYRMQIMGFKFDKTKIIYD